MVDSDPTWRTRRGSRGSDLGETVPRWAKDNPEKRIALLNLDVDFYEPAKVVLEVLWERMVPGGFVLLDDYGTFSGETQAVEEFFGPALKVQKPAWCYSPSYVVKE